MLRRHIHLLDTLLVRITSNRWNIRNSTLIYKRSLVVNWRLLWLLSTRSLHHLWMLWVFGWMFCVWLLKLTRCLVSSITSGFGEVPALNEFQISGGLRVHARLREVFGILMNRLLSKLFRWLLLLLLNLSLLAHDLLLLFCIYSNWLWRDTWNIWIDVIWVGLISVAVRINWLLWLDALLVRNVWQNFSSRTINLVILVVTWTIRITMFPTPPIIEIWLHYLHFWRW